MSKSHSRKVILAGSVGNVMEWFDFAIYGFFAPVIGRQFFPSDDPVASLLAAYGVFASGFLARPIGAAFFGHLGDRHGRKLVLRLSVILMGVSTGLVGILPNHAMIGNTAPILLVLMRIIQGFSVGGEYTGSVVYLVERAPQNKRGIVGGWTSFGAIAGFLLGSGVGALISTLASPEALSSWGWRIPFIAGVAIAGLATFFRRSLDETPRRESFDKRLPIVQAVRTEWQSMLRIAGLIMMANVGFYMMFVYVTTYLSEQVGVPMATALDIDTATMATLLIFTPIAAWISDRIGRKPVLLTASIGCLVCAVPLFWAIQHDDVVWIVFGQLGFALIIGLAFGANAATIVEVTRAPYRCTVVSVAYNITLAILGGTTPLVATWLIHETGDIMTPAYYLMGMSVITIITITLTKETAHTPIEQPEKVLEL
ncbi:MFS transporter [Rubellicoccus peritrichatus]|uniref:MFS transporter n=1 Tax=Rubellicoccus peritrichatus TaxID=3080537 RepID=A0AAQ3QVY1_9BACT|nr:MFS transporter [Puniceicoccus sp. CR14]WOO41342.1 MFS transporter [Puniceicoccus sp. CR14]